MAKKSKAQQADPVTETPVMAAGAESAGADAAKAQKKADKAQKQAARDKKKAAKADKKTAKDLKKAKKKVKKAQKSGKKSEKPEKKCRVFGSPIRNLIVVALMGILVGVAFIVKPALVYTYCGYGIGGLVALVGVIYLVIYFCRKPVSGEYRSEFVIGLAALLVGAYVAAGGLLSSTSSSGPNASTSISLTFSVIVKILGVAMAADGLMKLQYTLDIARMKYPKWWIALIFSVVGLALGVLTVMGLTYSIGSTLGLGSTAGISGIMTLGIAFCLNGIMDIAVMVVVALRNHKAEKDAALAEAEAILAAARGGDADFFTEDGSSADDADAVGEDKALESEPAPKEPTASDAFFAPEPQIELAEETPAAPVASEPDEPVLPEPPLASPTGDDPQ